MERAQLSLDVSPCQRAARADPSEGRWLKLATAASAGGEHGRAAEALEHVAQRHGGGDPALKARIQAERGLAGSRPPVP